MGNCSKGDQKKRYKDTLKVSLKDFNIPLKSLEQIGRSDVASSERMQMTTKQRVSAKVNECTKNAKPEPRYHHQSRRFLNLLTLFATDSLEPALA